MTQKEKSAGMELDDRQDGYSSRRQQRRERRAGRRADRVAGGGGWLAGLLLMGLGGLLLLQNSGYLQNFTNWWALFILLPAAASFSAAMGAYRRNDGVWTREGLGPLAASVIFLGLTVVFLFNLNFSFFGPLFLIAGGLLLLFGTR